jgi:TatD DNase family protein
MLVDTHAHLMDPAFHGDLAEVLRRAAVAGVVAMICVGYDEDSSREAVRLAEAHPQIFAAVGIHPNHAGQAAPGAYQRMRRLARHPRVVGIGETGLDNYRKHTPPAAQREWFRRHLDLSAELGLPVVVHNRQADDETARMLTDWTAETNGRARGVLHCFSGSRAMLSAGLDAGFMISIAGPVTFKNAAELPSLVVEVPTDRLVVETDCPYLAPSPHRGQRNEPAFVALTAARVAEIRGVSTIEIEGQTTENARRLFGDLPVATA